MGILESACFSQTSLAGKHGLLMFQDLLPVVLSKTIRRRYLILNPYLVLIQSGRLRLKIGWKLMPRLLVSGNLILVIICRLQKYTRFYPFTSVQSLDREGTENHLPLHC